MTREELKAALRTAADDYKRATDEVLARYAAAWNEGYTAAQDDALNQPYSDSPERATWKPTANPYRPEVLT